MKNIIVTIIFITGICSSAIACDICGCGAGSYYLGILPDFSSRIAGIRYRDNNVRTHIGPDGTTSYLTTDEAYHTMELWGGWTIKNKVRIMASVPLSYNTKKNMDADLSKTGLGDMTVQGFYRIWNKRSAVLKNKLLVNDLWVGGGIKLPTGKYEPADNDISGQSANLFQLGTGSADFLLGIMYDIRLQDAGINLSAAYKINTANKYEYYYGNKLSSSLQLYYKFRIKNKVTIAPNLGAGYEYSVHDLNEGYKVYTSGGYALYGTAGAELNYKRFALGGNYQPPLKQELANGAIKAGNRLMMHLSFMF